MPEPDFAVAPFTIIVDTREQSPFSFSTIRADVAQNNAPLVINTTRATLRTGDYSIEGHETTIAVERKSKSDLFYCVGSDRKRFQQQLERLNALPHPSALVVEASFLSIQSGDPESLLNPKTVFRSVLAWQQRLPNVHWWMCPTKAFAEQVTFRFLERYWKDSTNVDA